MTLSETICRAKANEVLADFMVASPDEIDLSTIAWRVGRLRIESGDLGTSEGRLVASGKGGVIRVRQDIQPEGRRRFTIAHEIGHFCLHGPTQALDSLKNMRTWTKGSKETEANIFAGELLMPERLFRPRVVKSQPSLAFVDQLAKEFSTSNLAAAVHFVQHTPEPCALVVSKSNEVSWVRQSVGFEWPLRRDTLHPYSGASEINHGTSGDTKGMVETPAGAWISNIDPDGRDSIQEDSRKVEPFGIVITLLWVRDLLD